MSPKYIDLRWVAGSEVRVCVSLRVFLSFCFLGTLGLVRLGFCISKIPPYTHEHDVLEIYFRERAACVAEQCCSGGDLSSRYV